MNVAVPTPAPAKPVGAVTAALRILRCLGACADSLRLSDIAGELGLNASTALNILRTLEFEGLVSFDRRSKRYALASGVADLAAPLLDRDDRERRVEQAMKAAAYELGATLALWRVVGEEVELMRVAESPTMIRIAYTLGGRVPMFLGAVGRLVAASGKWSPEELSTHFEQVPWARRPDYATWLAEVDAARIARSAVDRGYVNVGILGVAVPIETNGRPLQLVSAALFETEAKRDLAAVVARLRSVADA